MARERTQVGGVTASSRSGGQHKVVPGIFEGKEVFSGHGGRTRPRITRQDKREPPEGPLFETSLPGG
jgi:hypothetical protein